MKHFTLAAESVDPLSLRATVQHPGSGGCCVFEGWVRNSNDGRSVASLEYQAYAELALAEGERVVEEAIDRFGVIAVHCVHRTGHLQIGDLAVWIGVSAAHRDEAFRACRYIIDEIKRRLPVWKKEHYVDGDAEWVACAHAGVLHEHTDDRHNSHEREHRDHTAHAAASATRVLPDDFAPDYSRQMRLPEVGAAGQAKLAAARVLVLGAGGLGSPVLAYLAGAGVGTLGIVDADRLHASNLHRQTLYDARDVGERKVDLAARRIAAINPQVVVRTYAEPLHAGNAAGLFAQYDLVIECTDSLDSRYLSNDAAVISGTPLILASVYQYEGQLQVVSARPGAPCLRCLWPQSQSVSDSVVSCSESGVLGPVPGVLGGMQAMEALKWLLGLPVRLEDAVLMVNLLDGTSQRLQIDVAQGCGTRGGCIENARRAMDRALKNIDLELKYDDLHAAIAAGYLIVDVREAQEIREQPLRVESLHMPGAQVVERRAEMPAGRPLLLVCASGRRSGAIARTLRQLQMPQAYSLQGGVAALAGRRRGYVDAGA